MKCSIRELSRRLGVSDTAINKARAAGRIPSELFGESENGRPYVKDADQAEKIVSAVLSQTYLNQSEKRMAAGSSKDQSKRRGKPDPETPAEPEFDDPIDSRTGLPHINISNQKRAHYAAIEAQAKAEAAAGTHIPRTEVSQTAFNVARQIRNALELIEERLPNQLASERDPVRIRKLLHDEFREALSAMANEVANGRNAAA